MSPQLGPPRGSPKPQVCQVPTATSPSLQPVLSAEDKVARPRGARKTFEACMMMMVIARNWNTLNLARC